MIRRGGIGCKILSKKIQFPSQFLHHPNPLAHPTQKKSPTHQNQFKNHATRKRTNKTILQIITNKLSPSFE
jgi:hypothetical protein